MGYSRLACLFAATATLISLPVAAQEKAPSLPEGGPTQGQADEEEDL